MSGTNSTPAPSRSLNVLIVDDSGMMRTMIKRAAVATGLPIANLFEAGNGEQALAVLEREHVDALFTDLNMPVMNGLDFVEAARGLREGRGVPIVLLTTETAPELMARARFVKATGWLQKPLDGPRLLGLIAEMCD